MSWSKFLGCIAAGVFVSAVAFTAKGQQTVSNFVRKQNMGVNTWLDLLYARDTTYKASASQYKSSVMLVYNRNERSDLGSANNWSYTVEYTLHFTEENDSVQNSLQVSFNNGNPVYRDLRTHNPDSNEVSLRIRGIDSTGNPPGDIHLEVQLEKDVQSKKTLQAPALRMDASGDKPTLNWDAAIGSKKYELQWVYIDDKANHGNFSNNKDPFLFKEPVSITTSKNSYTPSLTYPEGKVYFRVRAVGGFPGYSNGTERKGPWSYGNNSSAITYTIGAQDALAPGKNWQMQTTYSEKGKYKKNVVYADGLGKARQSRVSMNSDSSTVVSEQKYDHEGRQSVNLLPAPVKNENLNQEQFAYQNNFNTFEASGDKPYDDASGAGVLDSSSGVAQYYSSNNQFNSSHSEYLPRAEGYAYSQQVFRSEPGSPVQKQSGAGKTHRIKSKDADPNNKHATQTLRGDPSREKLHSLFGSNVGDVSNYTKKATIDPNGQVSVKYLNQDGQVIASTLAGTPPEGMDTLNSFSDAKLTKKTLVSGRSRPQGKVSRSEHTISHLLKTPQEYTFHYDLKGVINSTGPDFGNLCRSCVYELDIVVRDPQGKILKDTSHTFSGPSDPDCSTQDSYDPGTFTVQVTFPRRGEYSVSKTLRLKDGAIHAGVEDVDSMAATQLDSSGIYDDYMDNVDSSKCDISCAQHCRTRMLEKYPSLEDDEEALSDSVETCVEEDCRDAKQLSESVKGQCESMYNQMKQQVSPGGYWNEDDSWLSDAISNTTFHDPDGSVSDPQPGQTELRDRQTFKLSWAEDLVDQHPEYCLYEACIEDTSGKLYDITMGAVGTWNDAVASGYVNPLDQDNLAPTSKAEKDPYFFSGNGQNMLSAMRDSLANYIDESEYDYDFDGDGNQTVLSLWEYVNSPELYQTNPPGGTEKWNRFQSFYMAMKRKVRKYNIENNRVANDGNCSIQEGDHAVWQGSKEMPGNSDEVDEDIEGERKQYCDAQCPVNADNWIYGLENTCEGTDFSDADSTEIWVHLKRYCERKCGTGDVHSLIPNEDTASDPNLQAIQNILGNYDGCGHLSDISMESTYDTCVYRNPEGDTACRLPCLQTIVRLMNDTLPVSSNTDLTPSSYNHTNWRECIPEGVQKSGSYISLFTDNDQNYVRMYSDGVEYESFMIEYDGGDFVEFVSFNEIRKIYNVECDPEGSGQTQATIIRTNGDTNQVTLDGDWFDNQFSKNIFEPKTHPDPVKSCYKDSCIYNLFHYTKENPNSYTVEVGGNQTPEYGRFNPDSVLCSPAKDIIDFDYDGKGDIYFHENANDGKKWHNGCRMSFFRTVADTAHKVAGSSTYDETFETMQDPWFVENAPFPDTLTKDTIKVFTGLTFKAYNTSADDTIQIYVYAQPRCGAGYNCQKTVPKCPSPEFDSLLNPHVDYEDLRDSCLASLGEKQKEYAKEEWEDTLTKYKSEYREQYVNDCYNKPFKEEFWYETKSTEHHYTLYYYDQADNLVQTVPPKGVSPVTPQFDSEGNYTGPEPNHTYKTQYRYNSAGQVTNKKTPDGGNTNYWYNSKGQLKLTQKARQEEQTDSMYSYVKYDGIGRVTESGRVTDITKDSAWWNSDQNQDDAFLMLDRHTFPEASGYSLEEITEVHYSDPFNNGGFSQDNLRTRVATVLRKDQENATRTTVTNYSYDEHGNVKKLRQALPGDLDPKITAYEYSLHSGNIKKVKYQQGETDMFLHKFIYDADNRLTRVKTSEDGHLWQEDARYFYYPHGPLKRMEAGEYKVQGKDYYYTLQGWVKGVNSEGLQPGNDPGSDGVSSTKNRFVGLDEYGYSLSYFNDDYHSIGSDESMLASKQNLPLSNEAPSLYNGNIRAMTTTIQNTNDQAAPQLKTYEYDQLNRLRETEAWQSFNTTDNSWSNSANNNYATSMSYDQNGNIQTLTRRKQNGTVMDALDYKYDIGTNNNKLGYINDGSGHSDSNIPDIADQADDNYAYDASGNMTQDLEAEIDSISWTVDGKVKEVFRTDGSGMDDLEFVYDGMGNRVKKIVKTRSSGTLNPEEEWTVYYYVRDANGQLMSLYKRSYNATSGDRNLTQAEVPVYGSGREGVYKPNRNVKTISSSGSVTNHTRNLSHAEEELGLKSYQFTDHRGNVNVIVADLKLGIDTDSDGEANRYDAQIESSKDYYAFGMTMPGRGFDPADTKYGFNGKRQDREVTGSGSHYDFGARMYDSRVGRWMSRDPLEAKYPSMSPYQFAANTPLMAVDKEGEDIFISIIEENGRLSIDYSEWNTDIMQNKLQNASDNVRKKARGVKNALDHLKDTENEVAQKIFKALDKSLSKGGQRITLEESAVSDPHPGVEPGQDPNGWITGTVDIDHTTKFEKNGEYYYQSPALEYVAHELGHILDIYLNADEWPNEKRHKDLKEKRDNAYKRWKNNPRIRKEKANRSWEYFAFWVQNQFAKGLDDPIKPSYQVQKKHGLIPNKQDSDFEPGSPTESKSPDDSTPGKRETPGPEDDKYEGGY